MKYLCILTKIFAAIIAVAIICELLYQISWCINDIKMAEVPYKVKISDPKLIEKDGLFYIRIGDNSANATDIYFDSSFINMEDIVYPINATEYRFSPQSGYTNRYLNLGISNNESRIDLHGIENSIKSMDLYVEPWNQDWKILKQLISIHTCNYHDIVNFIVLRIRQMFYVKLVDDTPASFSLPIDKFFDKDVLFIKQSGKLYMIPSYYITDSDNLISFPVQVMNATKSDHELVKYGEIDTLSIYFDPYFIKENYKLQYTRDSINISKYHVVLTEQ